MTLPSLRRQVATLLADERRYLKEHKPARGNCAAWHRGAIEAYSNILDRLPKAKSSKEPDEVKEERNG